MSVKIEEALAKEGLIGVGLYRQSFISNDRYATGKTNRSVNSNVSTNGNVTTLTISGRKDIGTLETGVTAQQYKASGSTFEDINQWVQARGLGDSAVTGLIVSSLERNGWSQDPSIGNRTGKNGGTKDIITNPTQQIIKSVGDSIVKVSKDLILDSIKI